MRTERLPEETGVCYAPELTLDYMNMQQMNVRDSFFLRHGETERSSLR